MTEEIKGVALTDVPTSSQRMFVRYLMAILIDLTVLNLFDEYWEHVTVDSFTDLDSRRRVATAVAQGDTRAGT